MYLPISSISPQMSMNIKPQMSFRFKSLANGPVVKGKKTKKNSLEHKMQAIDL